MNLDFFFFKEAFYFLENKIKPTALLWHLSKYREICPYSSYMLVCLIVQDATQCLKVVQGTVFKSDSGSISHFPPCHLHITIWISTGVLKRHHRPHILLINSDWFCLCQFVWHRFPCTRWTWDIRISTRGMDYVGKTIDLLKETNPLLNPSSNNRQAGTERPPKL